MSNETIFYTPLVSILGFIIVLFTLYRLLVTQKDSVIELLKKRNDILEKRISELEAQSPDILVESLEKRVQIARNEIKRLNKDGKDHKDEILKKKGSLQNLGEKLTKLNQLLEKEDLLCPHCQAPLLRRDWKTIYGVSNGRDAEAEIEYVEYECGFATLEGESEPLNTCENSAN